MNDQQLPTDKITGGFGYGVYDKYTRAQLFGDYDQKAALRRPAGSIDGESRIDRALRTETEWIMQQECAS